MTAGSTSPKWKDTKAFYKPANEKPFNEYLMGTKVEPDIYSGDAILEYTEVPVLRCPSDTYSNQERFLNPNQDVEGNPCYIDVGVSYHWNLHCLEDVNWNGDFEETSDARS